MALELQRVDPWYSDYQNSTGLTYTGVTYYGYATAGTQDTDPMWSIKMKSVNNGVLSYTYPYTSGTTLVNTYPAITVDNVYYSQLSGLIWANRSGYTYR